MVIYRIEPEATSCFPETAKESRLRPVCSWGLFITQRKKDEKKIANKPLLHLLSSIP
jgi:hypothetical protein